MVYFKHLGRFFIAFIMIVATPACAIGMTPNQTTNTITQPLQEKTHQTTTPTDINLNLIKNQARQMKTDLQAQKQNIENEINNRENHNNELNNAIYNVTNHINYLEDEIQFLEGPTGIIGDQDHYRVLKEEKENSKKTLEDLNNHQIEVNNRAQHLKKAVEAADECLITLNNIINANQENIKTYIQACKR